MSNMINFGIDLGTTNSLIAKFNKGEVEVFKNPSGFKETLPSVVGCRNDRILVGDQARTYVERDPNSIVSRFKRLMGTTESFQITALGRSVTPVELSSCVLKELKTFIHTGESPDAVIITIPASFDMVQANATKEAGYIAGFKQVELLQEPIAASLAYANKEKNVDLSNSQWIVYDLGGGTYDVALVKIIEGELRIVDHEGNNFLGGADFDALIVEHLIVPQLNTLGHFSNLIADMKSLSGAYNRLWTTLLHKAEEAKIELSNKQISDIDLGLIRDLKDENGKIIDNLISITRSDYESIIKDAIDSTAEMLKTILTRNSIVPQDLDFILMVGGSTYTPYVRNRIEELLGVPVSTEIDPTNAIVVGAAYYAATRPINLDESPRRVVQKDQLKVKVSYCPASQEQEEMFAAKIDGHIEDLFYRITRDDGGFDSGLKKLTSRIHEDLPLLKEAYNTFTLKIFDSQNNIVPAEIDTIHISQGKYTVSGQPLPEDLCMVVDDVEGKDVRLELLFPRNTVLPRNRKVVKSASKTLIHGTDDEIRIMVKEGPSTNRPDANVTIGVLVIPAKQLRKDVLRDTDIELEFEVDESRLLSVKAYVSSLRQEYSRVFDTTKHEVSIEILNEEMESLEERLESEKHQASDNENYELAHEIDNLQKQARIIRTATINLRTDDVNKDAKHKLEAQKRKIAQELARLTSSSRVERLRDEYLTLKAEFTHIIKTSGNDSERRQLNELVEHEKTFINSIQGLEGAMVHIRSIEARILRRTPDFLLGAFQYVISKRESLNDQSLATNLIVAGYRHVEMEDYEKLGEVISRLISLLPEDQDTESMRQKMGVGIK
ncbi:MAG: Hsp70 family protein [Planctomycetota bacterium]|nr:Hsp70 family protein [Planctomycetota bacterium]